MVMSLPALSAGAAGVRHNLAAFDRAAREVSTATGRQATLPGGPLSAGGDMGAGAGLQPFAEEPVSPPVDLPGAFTSMRLSRHGVAANLTTVRTASQVYAEVVNLI